MFQNYFKTALRNLLRYKGFSVINIVGLAIGITGCLAIGLFVLDERKFDKTIPQGENIYRIYEERKDENATTHSTPVPPAYGPFLLKQYPEVEATTRMMMAGDKYLLERGETRAYIEGGKFVDSTFIRFFSLQMLKGNAATALTTPQAIVLNDELATRYFGKEDPIGKTIYVDKDTFEVRGVLAALPSHFHLQFKYLMPMSAVDVPAERMQRWSWHQFYSYIKLKPGADALALQNKFQSHIKTEILPKAESSGSSFMPFFQPLKDVHLKSSDFVYDNALRGNESYVNGLTIIALFVLVIACFNFINLATARSFRRAKEIGVRKVVGADRKQLIVQFLFETVLLSVIAIIVSVVITLLLLPALNQFTGKSISFNPVSNPLSGLLILAAGIVIGILAGIYPAFILSGFQPITVLKNIKFKGGSSGSWLRPALVVIQFSLSILLIISTIIVYRQTQYLNNKDLGFNKEQVVYFQTKGGADEKLETFKDELRKSSAIVSVTSGYGLPGDAFAGESIAVETKDGEKKFPTSVFIGDHDYIKTLGLKLIKGRDFSREMSTDVREAFIINETAVKNLGFGTAENAIGKSIHWDEWEPADTLNPVKKGKIIGVVSDFHYKSLHEKVSTAIIQLYPQVNFKVAAKLRAGSTTAALAHIQKTWDSFAPDYPLDYQFMDETYGAMYKTEGKMASLIWLFTIMAIFVGCMGLFGLAAFSAEQKTKEIGIRKVLGASVFSITQRLSRNFLGLVVLAAIIAFPLAWWAMNSWLQNFEYRITISWWIFIAAGAVALLVALLTVSFQAIKAAIANPVKSLRTE